MKNQTIRDLTHIAIVAALYVVLTIVPPFNLVHTSFELQKCLIFWDFIIASISLL